MPSHVNGSKAFALQLKYERPRKEFIQVVSYCGRPRGTKVGVRRSVEDRLGDFEVNRSEWLTHHYTAKQSSDARPVTLITSEKQRVRPPASTDLEVPGLTVEDIDASDLQGVIAEPASQSG
eukprot:11395507-Karenia_brevis.AAC.1